MRKRRGRPSNLEKLQEHAFKLHRSEPTGPPVVLAPEGLDIAPSASKADRRARAIQNVSVSKRVSGELLQRDGMANSIELGRMIKELAADTDCKRDDRVHADATDLLVTGKSNATGISAKADREGKCRDTIRRNERRSAAMVDILERGNSYDTQAYNHKTELNLLERKLGCK